MNKWLHLAENERPFAVNGWRKVKFVTIVMTIVYCEIYIVKLMKNLRNWFLLSRGKAESGPQGEAISMEYEQYNSFIYTKT